MRVLYSPDANTETASSAVSDAKQVTATTATTESSPAKGAKQDGQVDFEEAAIADVLSRRPATEKETTSQGESPTPKDNGQAAEAASDIRKSNATTKEEEAKKTEEAAKPEPEKAKAQVNLDDFSDVPFNKHERFQQLLKDRNEQREALAKIKPVVERHETVEKYCRTNNITPDMYSQMLQIGAAFVNDPQKAIEMLKPINEQLGRFKGEVLPDDLRQQVDAGTLTLEMAQRVARAENQQKFVQQRAQQNQALNEQQQVQSALTNWDQNVKRSDPDYSRKEQLVIDRFIALSAGKQLDPTVAVQLAQQAYNDVTKSIQGFIPAPATTKILTSSSTRTDMTPNTKDLKWEDAEEVMVQQYRHNGRRR